MCTGAAPVEDGLSMQTLTMVAVAANTNTIAVRYSLMIVPFTLMEPHGLLFCYTVNGANWRSSTNAFSFSCHGSGSPSSENSKRW
jgi:hypothetical protein